MQTTMKKKIIFLSTALVIAASLPAQAQLGRPGGPTPDSMLSKIFGTNLNLSADMDISALLPSQETVTIPGKIYFANGKSRTEMDMTKMKGSKMPPQAIEQMKTMGMDKIISISRPEQDTTFLIYPGLESYAKMTTTKAAGTNDMQVEKTELGKDSVDGHPCVKTSYIVHGGHKGENVTLIAWLATDLKNCPIKIEIPAPVSAAGNNHSGSGTTLHLSAINLTAPAASLFEPPVGYRVYTDVQAMMQTEVLKKMGAAKGMPAGHPPTQPANHP